jgi:hypothetical protein
MALSLLLHSGMTLLKSFQGNSIFFRGLHWGTLEFTHSKVPGALAEDVAARAVNVLLRKDFCRALPECAKNVMQLKGYSWTTPLK